MRGNCNLTNAQDIKELKDWVKDYVSQAEEGPKGGSRNPILYHLINSVKGKNPEWVADIQEAIRSIYGEDVLDVVTHVPQDPALVGDIVSSIPISSLSSPFRTAKARVDNETLTDADETGGSHNWNPEKEVDQGIFSWLGSDQFNAIWFGALGVMIDESKMAKVYQSARELSWEDFSNWALDQGADFGDNLAPLKKLWIVNQEVNSLPLKDKLSWVYANFQNMAGGAGKGRWTKYFKREHTVVDSEGNPVNLLTQNKLSLRANKNFIDNLKTKVRGKNVGDITHYFGLNKIFKVIHNRKTNSWWAREDAGNIKMLELLELFTDFLVNEGVALVGMSASDKGNMLGVEIQQGHVDTVLSKSSLIEAMKKQPNKFSERFIKDFEDSKFNASIYYRKLKDRMMMMKKRGKLTPDARQSFNNFHVLITTIATNNTKKYLLQERKNGVFMEDKDIDNFLKNILDVPRNPKTNQMMYPPYLNAIALVAKHEWYKAVRGNQYLKYNSLHTFNRMRLSVTDGYVPVGVGPTKHIIIDPSKVDFYIDGKKVDNIKTLRGLTGKTNLLDGLSMVSTRLLKNTSDMALGLEQKYSNDHAPRELKTVLMNISDDMNSYVEFKHSEQEAYNNLEIVKKGKSRRNPDNVIVTTKKVKDEIVIYNNGEVIDMVTDTDGAKTFYGDYKVNTSFELPESARRVIIAPSTQSNMDVYGPIQYLNALHLMGYNKQDKDSLKEYADIIYDMIENESSKYINSWIDAAEDPDLLRSIVGYMYSEKSQGRENVRNKLLARKGYGIHHPDSLYPIRRMLLNNQILRGSMQGRSYRGSGDGNNNTVDTAGSDYFLKPYLGDKIQLVNENNEIDNEAGMPEGVILSSGNKAIYNHIVDLMGMKEGVPSVALVNQWLRENPTHVLTYRSPILKLDSIAPRRIVEFTQRDDGNAIYHHPLDVGIRLVGDFDIDEAGVMIIPSKYDIDTLWKFQFSNIFQRSMQASADLGVFDIPEPAALSDNMSMLSDMVTTIAGHNAQGRMTNLKNLTNNIAHHIKKITIFLETEGGRVNEVELTPKKKTQKVVMDYAPLKAGVNEKTLRDLGWSGIAEITTIDGVNYLKTTVEHELNLILNAAVDHPKLNMLTKSWGFNMEDESGNLWLMKRMFNVSDPDLLTEKHYKVLNGSSHMPDTGLAITKIFNMSNIRKGKNALYQSLSEVDLMDNIKKIYDFLSSSASDKKAALETAEYRVSTGATLKMDVEVNDNDMTYEERHAVLPYQMMIDKFGENPPESSYDYDQSRIDVASYKARNFLKDWVKENYGKVISKSDYEAARNFARGFMTSFYNIVGEKNHNNNTIQRDPKLLALLEREYTKLLELETKHETGDQNKTGMMRAIITSVIIGGIGKKNIANVLPFQDILSDIAMENWGKKWESVFFSSDLDISDLEGLKEAGFSSVDIINKDLC
tara:strand:+ start:18198 stop:22505 length:4308 start_codon:yes stop_codon:yes gene_type:complete